MKLTDFGFRIWHRDSKRFFFSDEVVIGKDEECGEMHAWHNGEPLCSESCEIELRAFANSLWLYENDIVRFEYKDENLDGLIAFHSGFGCEIYWEGVYNGFYPLDEIEIISVEGNIHEDLDDLRAELVDLIDENAPAIKIHSLEWKIVSLKNFLEKYKRGGKC